MSGISVHGRTFAVVFGVCLLFAAQTAGAAPISLTEDFSNAGSLPGPFLEQSPGGIAAAFNGINATFPGTLAPDRSYLRTLASDYYTTSFVADITVTISGTAGGGTVFFGMGVGEPLPSFFYEPRAGQHLFVRPGPDNFLGGGINVTDQGLDHHFPGDLSGTGTHRLRMSWDALTQEMTFAIHQDYAGGPFVASSSFGPYDGSDNGFDATNSHIFFGGVAGTTFDDLTITVAEQSTIATFDVAKDFDDDNPMGVQVFISCNDGLPIQSGQIIREGNGVTFVVERFSTGELECDVFEEQPITGYKTRYTASGDAPSNSDREGCHYTTVEFGDENLCVVTNKVKPVDIDVIKEWQFQGKQLGIDDTAVIVLECLNVEGGNGEIKNSDMFWVWKTVGDEINSARVKPRWDDSTLCHVKERIVDDAVESDSSCEDWFAVGVGDVRKSCLISDTVFFEGIPMLNHYGLVMLVLLMLGIGAVGVRRL